MSGILSKKEEGALVWFAGCFDKTCLKFLNLDVVLRFKCLKWSFLFKDTII